MQQPCSYEHVKQLAIDGQHQGAKLPGSPPLPGTDSWPALHNTRRQQLSAPFLSLLDTDAEGFKQECTCAAGVCTCTLCTCGRCLVHWCEPICTAVHVFVLSTTVMLANCESNVNVLPSPFHNGLQHVTAQA